jgi:hypothetical protein
MAITGTLTIIDTDFSDALGGIVSACSPNVLRVTATLSGGTSLIAFCEIELSGYTFRFVNKSFNGTTGEFHFDFTDILPYFFTDISDDELTSGVQTVIDTFSDDFSYDVYLYDGVNPTQLDVFGGELAILFSSKQIGNPNGSNEVDIFNHQMPNFLAQKNKQSYIYHYGAGVISFEKVSHIPTPVILIDNFFRPFVVNGKILIYNF